MFERYTDRARRAVVLAQENARLLNHHTIGVDHLFLGLLQEHDGVAGQALEALGYNLNDIRDLLTPGESSPAGHIPFTADAQKVLEGSLREALRLGHNYIGTEHILLGICRFESRERDNILQPNSDIAWSRIRQKVIELLSGYHRGSDPTPAPTFTVTATAVVALDDAAAPVNDADLLVAKLMERTLNDRIIWERVSDKRPKFRTKVYNTEIFITKTHMYLRDHGTRIALAVDHVALFGTVLTQSQDLNNILRGVLAELDD
jgi:hypothetical protein